MATEMIPNIYEPIATFLGVSQTTLAVIFALIGVWTLVWEGLALWKSARKGQWIWFVVFLIVHVFGILEILYIFIFSKMGGKSKVEIEKPVEKISKFNTKKKK